MTVGAQSRCPRCGSLVPAGVLHTCNGVDGITRLLGSAKRERWTNVEIELVAPLDVVPDATAAQKHRAVALLLDELGLPDDFIAAARWVDVEKDAFGNLVEKS